MRAKERPVRRRRFLAVAALLAALFAAIPAALGSLGERKDALDARIAQLQERIAAAERRERVLTTDIAASREEIDTIEERVRDLSVRVRALEHELARHRARLAGLREQYARETALLAQLERSERIAEDRLHRRLVDIYETGSPSALEILLSVSSLSDLVSQLEYAQTIAARDEEIARSVAEARARVAVARLRTQAIKREEEQTVAVIAERTQQQRTVLAELTRRRDQLVQAQADRRALLARVRAQRRGAEEDLGALQRESARLAERIRAAQQRAAAAGGGQEGAGSSSAPSSQGSGGSAAAGAEAPSASGFIWPVNGPITSPFGWRWGRMHEGIDIGAGYGTPIHAAAAGTVIWAGWMGGYGNLVVLDHGGGLSTAYGHQQRIYVHVGQRVAQGEVIGEVGSTGHAFGPHLHFEVRVNGTPVDPLRYL